MPHPAFLSYAVDAEDVVLHRALGWVTPGTYLEVAPVAAEEQSPTRALADLGWRGVLVAGGDGAARRPGEDVAEDLAGATASLDGALHLAVVPGPAAARELLASGARPWVLLVRPADADEHDAPEGYVRRLVVGRSEVLVAAEHDARLGELLSYPADSRDGFERATEAALRADLEDAARSIQRWRAAALAGWPGDAAEEDREPDQTAALLAHELAAVKATLSWRVTRPLRMVSTLAPVRRLRARR